jgi:anaerobic selenocysteine-containing dehydrogenase
MFCFNGGSDPEYFADLDDFIWRGIDLPPVGGMSVTEPSVICGARTMAARRDVTGIRPYDAPAGGWGALKATAKAVHEQMNFAGGPKVLLQTNKPDGFDCPGCAWPDPEHTSAFQFCENGAKAVTWEATKKRVTAEFFAANTISSLLQWTDHDLEDEGRLTEPMAYDATSDTYRPVSWDEAFARIGTALRALPDPNMAEFYTSGRASNEAAFLY